MVDPLDRRSFEKPSPSSLEFQEIVKGIRRDFNELLKTLFFSSDLGKRKRAFQDIKNLRILFSSRLDRVSSDKRKAVLAALQQDMRKLEIGLKSTPISIYMKIDGIHVPLFSQVAGQPFTLWDFLEDGNMLADREVAFRIHMKKVDGKHLSSWLPGFDEGDFQETFEEKKRLHLPFSFNYSGIDYSLTSSQPSGSYDIACKCPLRKLSQRVEFDIPRGVMPGDLNSALDRLLSRE